jgi:hypothetical protein
MKKKSIQKLRLSKTTIAHLSKPAQAKVEGGAPPSFTWVCPTPATFCFYCPPKTFDGNCTIIDY